MARKSPRQPLSVVTQSEENYAVVPFYSAGNFHAVKAPSDIPSRGRKKIGFYFTDTDGRSYLLDTYLSFISKNDDAKNYVNTLNSQIGSRDQYESNDQFLQAIKDIDRQISHPHTSQIKENFIKITKRQLVKLIRESMHNVLSFPTEKAIENRLMSLYRQLSVAYDENDPVLALDGPEMWETQVNIALGDLKAKLESRNNDISLFDDIAQDVVEDLYDGRYHPDSAWFMSMLRNRDQD